MYIIPGGVRADLPAGWIPRLRETLQTVEETLDDVKRVLLNNGVFKARSRKLGIIEPEMIEEYGITGPNARGSGIKRDIRKDSPYLVYGQLDFSVVTEDGGDAYARTRVRIREMYQSINLMRQMLRRLESDPPGLPFHTKLPNVLHWRIPPGETYRKAECTRGEYGYYLNTDGTDKPRRIYVRGPSYTHAVALMERLAVGTNIADTAGLMVSLHTYPPEVER
jgi:NADH-quinone oxidoreductase subunit D